MDKINLMNLLKSIGVAVLSTVLLLFAFNYIAYRQNDPDSVIGIFSYVILILSSGMGAVFAVRGEEERPFLSVFLFCIVYGLIYSATAVFSDCAVPVLFIRITVILLSSFFFAFVFFPRKQKQGKVLKQFRKYNK